MPRKKVVLPETPKAFQKPIEASIALPTLLSSGSVENYEAETKTAIEVHDLQIKIERLKKLYAIAEHFDLKSDDPNFWMKLCFAIAENFLEGFQVVQPEAKHRPKEWNDAVLYVLWYEVEKLAQKDGNRLQACRTLSKKEPWKHLLKQGGGTALYQHYQKARNCEFIKFVQKLESDARLKGEDWQATLYDALVNAINL